MADRTPIHRKPFLIILAWSAFWLNWNLPAPRRLQFDPPMAFVLWLFISNMIQILLMPLIMVGQELRAEHDLHVNIRAEREDDRDTDGSIRA